MSNNKDNQNKNNKNNQNKNNQNKNNQNKNNKNKNKEQIYDLALLCQFQNSKNILRSWLQHHIWQGFQHFYLIDDNSTDGSKEILQEFIDNGVVTHFTRSGKKVDNYRWAFQQIRAKTKWLAICDVNDFFYGVNKKLVTMIKQHIAPHFDMVLCNGFCYTCENEDELYNPVCNAVSRHPLLSKSTKYIFRVKSVVHPSQIWLESLLYPQTKLMMTKHAKTLFTNTIVRLNHYEMSHNDNDKNNDENICESKQYLVDTTLKDLVERTPENY